MGWIANLIILIGTWLVGGKEKIGFIFVAFGEALWVYVGINRKELDITSICIIFTIMALINYRRWK